MNRFSIINNLQKQVNQLQEQVSFLEYYLKETVGMADMRPFTPPTSPATPTPLPNPTQPSYPQPFNPPTNPPTNPIRPQYRSGVGGSSRRYQQKPMGSATPNLSGQRPVGPQSPGSQSSQQSPPRKKPPVRK